MSLPARVIDPELGVSRPATIRSVVVLPQPDGPEQGEERAAGHVEVELADGVEGPEVLGQLPQREPVVRRRVAQRLGPSTRPGGRGLNHL